MKATILCCFVVIGTVFLSACGQGSRQASSMKNFPDAQLLNVDLAAATHNALSPARVRPTACNPDGLALTPEEAANCGRNPYTQVLTSLTTSASNSCGLFRGGQDRLDDLLPPTGNWRFVFHQDGLTVDGTSWNSDNCSSTFSRRAYNKYECESRWTSSSSHALSVITFDMSGFTARKYVYGDPSGTFNGLCGFMTMTLGPVQLACP